MHKQWEFTRAFGTRMIGQPEVALIRLTGIVLHSLPGTAISGQGLASGMDQLASINVLITTGGIHGRNTGNSVMLSGVRWTGSGTSTWSMTTAKTINASTDSFPLNVLSLNTNNEVDRVAVTFLILYYILCKKVETFLFYSYFCYFIPIPCLFYP